MKVAIRYFASLREALGEGESVEVAPATSVGALRDRLIESDPAHAAVLGRDRVVRSALDRAICAESAVIGESAEVAFFPPVTGG